MATQSNPKVDAYIQKAPAFAQPILEHLRQLIHKSCPKVVESIKWSRPFFEYKGAILCNVSAFKEHCSMGFWGEEIGAVLRKAKAVQEEGMGTLGKIRTLDELPSDKVLLGWLRQAVAFVDDGSYTSPIAARRKVVKPDKPIIEMPIELDAALKKNKKAREFFERSSPSCQREYLQWISEAKRAETREKRVATAIEWLSEGKQRNWKYEAGAAV